MAEEQNEQIAGKHAQSSKKDNNRSMAEEQNEQIAGKQPLLVKKYDQRPKHLKVKEDPDNYER